MVRILCIAQLTRAYLVDRCQALSLVVIESTTPKPLLEALEMDVAARACALAWRNQRVLNPLWLLFVGSLIFLHISCFISIVTEADSAGLFFMMLLEGLHARAHPSDDLSLALYSFTNYIITLDTSLYSDGPGPCDARLVLAWVGSQVAEGTKRSRPSCVMMTL